MRIPLRGFLWVLLGASLAGIVFLFAICDFGRRTVRLVNSLAFSRDGKWLAAGMVNARSAEEPFKSYWEDVCHTVALMPVSDPAQTRIVAQDIRRGNQGPLNVATPVVAFGPDDEVLSLLLFPAELVRQYDLAAGAMVSTSELLGPDVQSFRYSPDGSRAAVATGRGVRLIDLATGEVTTSAELTEINVWIRESFEFSEDGRWMVLSTFNRVGKVFDARTGERVFQSAPNWDCHPMRISPAGDRLAIADQQFIRIVTLEPGPEGLRTADVKTIPAASAAMDAAFSSDGERLACCGEGWLRIFRAADGSLIGEAPCRTAARTMKWSGETIAIGDTDGNVTLWDAGTLVPRSTVRLRGIERISWVVPTALLVCWMVIAAGSFRRWAG